jgi:phage terminase small subunit
LLEGGVRAMAEKRLTKKEVAFCEEFVLNGGNASRAYATIYGCCIEDARKRYCKTFRKPEIKEYISSLQKEAFDAACINAERVALRLADIAFADKEDEIYTITSQLKALDLLQKQLGLQKQRLEADVNTDINITIDE